MNEDDRDRLIHESISNPSIRERIIHDAHLSDRERAEISAIGDTADAVWLAAHGAPPLITDPVAAMLGLVPDRECGLDVRALTQARKRAGLNVSDLAARLRDRGWNFQKNDVFRWETRSATDVSPAVIQAIAEVLDIPVDSLISVAGTSSPAEDQLASARRHPLFDQLVDRWARVQNISRAVAAAALESRMAATVHRGQRPDSEQLLRSLEALVVSVEGPDEE
ncbi:helix-turn-helix domain-containing protein [Mycobacteroides abscessus]|uniref:helix-turn-helix domain-containing protein n=1 Tax=Mycobacteroides abscessus TaxID=36809 RepID=UPI000C26A057|nr:helix-turn-helix domain-containing protein [Mycobacteroides abscessus]MDM2496019.1 helix-turn-helix domain-containing protein [Mycobacteroides abscessus]MDM2514622.1 helix-turn-helix domain-containing protein [Mycobacteroides abscessus]MDM2523590.1 helix-turn-helix domain-containing protein [Mycobacteroides abscessus]MDM2529783.1 helix-turn-helix domain-containing protein [Mycobacteroides abscessus]MDM2531364.1 helix-turn-helix domain-containing protein [Mycobacteroides abscessus]